MNTHHKTSSFAHLPRHCDARMRTYETVRLRCCASCFLQLGQNMTFSGGVQNG